MYNNLEYDAVSVERYYTARESFLSNAFESVNSYEDTNDENSNHDKTKSETNEINNLIDTQKNNSDSKKSKKIVRLSDIINYNYKSDKQILNINGNERSRSISSSKIITDHHNLFIFQNDNNATCVHLIDPQIASKNVSITTSLDYYLNRTFNTAIFYYLKIVTDLILSLVYWNYRFREQFIVTLSLVLVMLFFVFIIKLIGVIRQFRKDHQERYALRRLLLSLITSIFHLNMIK
jgi:hypothetical protein